MVEAKNNESAHVLNEINLLYKKFDFTDEMLKVLLVKQKNQKWKLK
jgi:hypothetical protein